MADRGGCLNVLAAGRVHDTTAMADLGRCPYVLAAGRVERECGTRSGQWCGHQLATPDSDFITKTLNLVSRLCRSMMRLCWRMCCMADVSNRLILSLSNRKAIIFSIYNHVYRIDYREQRSRARSRRSGVGPDEEM